MPFLNFYSFNRCKYVLDVIILVCLACIYVNAERQMNAVSDEPEALLPAIEFLAGALSGFFGTIAAVILGMMAAKRYRGIVRFGVTYI